MEFEDKVVLVTGASAGIGEATALELAQQGALLALTGRNAGALEDVARRCEAHHGRPALTIVAELAEEGACELIAKRTLEHFGRLDVLVNNAAMTARCVLENVDMATFDRVFAVNVRAVVDLTRRLTPALVAAKGSIVNVSSISGSTVSLGSLPYSMSKAALNHFSRLIALELAPKGVRVNTVSPGVTVSKLVQRTTGISDAEYAAFLQEYADSIPTGAWCSAREVAAAVAWAASPRPARRNLTGADIPVDGGLRFTATNNSMLMKQKEVQK